MASVFCVFMLAVSVIKMLYWLSLFVSVTVSTFKGQFSREMAFFHP